MRRRIAAFFLITALLLSMTPGALAATDIDKHWAKDQILLLSEKGIMQGNGKGSYRPDANITRAEFAALINRTFGFTKEGDTRFSDVTYSGDWKSQAVTRAATMGYMLGSGGKANPDGFISRQEAAAMLIRVLKLPLETGNASFHDEDTIASWAKAYIATAEKFGIVTAMPSGNFEPVSSLSRAQAATILARAMGELYNKAGSYVGGNISGNVTISTSGVTLENATVEGNLYLTEGIGTGTATLRNVTVKGLTFVAGGGNDGGVIAEDATFAGNLEVGYPEGYLSGVRFALKGLSGTNKVDVKSPCTLDTAGLGIDAAGVSDLLFDAPNADIALNGNFGSFSLDDPTTLLSVDSGTVSSLTLSAGTFSQKYQITVKANGIIAELNLNAPTTVTGSGILSNVLVNSGDSTIGADIIVNINNIRLSGGLPIKVGNNTLMPYGEAAQLKGLVLKSADGSEEIPMESFSGTKLTYQAYSDASTVRVYPSLADDNEDDDSEGYKITVNGEEVASGSYLSVDTEQNETIRIQVSCEGKNTSFYTVTMAELAEPVLSGLSVYNSDNKISVPLSTSFDPEVTKYTAYTSGTNMKITAEADAGQSIKIGDQKEATGSSSGDVIVAATQKSIDIVVSNGVQSVTYTVTITKQQTTGAIYPSSTKQGSGTNAEWTITMKSPSNGDTFSILDKDFIIGETSTEYEAISRTDALKEIAATYADHKVFTVSASDKALTFANKTPGVTTGTSSVSSNFGTVTKTEGRNRKNGTCTLTVKALPVVGGDPVELKINNKTYRFCPLASDVETSYDIPMTNVTTTDQAASLLQRKLSDSTTGGFLTSYSGSSIVVSSGDITAPTITYDSTLFSVTKSEGNAAEAETFVLTLPEITEGMVLSITVNGQTSDFEAHDRIVISEDDPASDIAKAFYSSAFKATANGTSTVIFQSRLIGSSGNSQEITTSGSIISSAVQTKTGEDTTLGTCVISVAKVPKFGDTLTIDDTVYLFGNTSDDTTINVAKLSSSSDVVSAIKKLLGDKGKVSGTKITVTSTTAEPPNVVFTPA